MIISAKKAKENYVQSEANSRQKRVQLILFSFQLHTYELV